MILGKTSQCTRLCNDRCIFTRSEVLDNLPLTLAVIADHGAHADALHYFSGLWDRLTSLFVTKHPSHASIRRCLEKGLTDYLSVSVFDTHYNNFVQHGGILALLLAYGNRFELRCTGNCRIYRQRRHRLKALLVSEPNDAKDASEYTVVSHAGKLYPDDTFLLCRGSDASQLPPDLLRSALGCADDTFDACADMLCKALPQHTDKEPANMLAVRFLRQSS